MAGETSQGSITANITANASDYNAVMDGVAAKARELGSTDPNVRVSADTADASAKLAAVEAETRRVGDTSRTVSAENEAGQEREIALWQIMAAAIALIIPALGPLAAYVAAVGGAFAGMAVAGLLAFEGIKTEIAAGTAQGQQFSAGVNTIKSDLTGLESTAASGVLSGFQNVVSILNSDMPELNTEVSTFSRMLSGDVGPVVQGIVNVFRILNPLFVVAGGYVSELASGFEQWTSNGGLQKFGAYAEQVLPQVTQTIGQVANGAMNLVEALAPLGQTMLQLAGTAAQLVGGLASGLGPAFPVIVAGAAAVVIGFQAWTAIPAIVTSVNGALEAMGVGLEVAGGPVGWVIAGLTALAAVTLAFTTATQNSTAAVGDYTGALQADNDAVGKNTTTLAAHQIQQSGLLTTAKSLGLSLTDLTGAVTGNGAAYQRVSGAINDHIASLKAQAAAGTSGAGATAEEASKLQLLEQYLDASKKKIDDQKKSLDSQTSASQNAAFADQSRLTPLQQLTQAENNAATAQDKATKAAQAYVTFIQEQNNDALKSAQAQATLQGDYNNFAQTVVQAETTMSKAKATSLDVNTQAGLQNHNLILQSVSDAISEAQTVLQSDKEKGLSTQQATADSNAALQSNIQQIEQHATAAGLDSTQVQDLVNSVIDLSKVPNPQVFVSVTGVTDAINNIKVLDSQLAALASKTAVTAGAQQLIGVSVTGGRQFQANGGTTGLTDGGTWSMSGSVFSDSMPTSLSLGEEVTSNRYGQADRNRPVLKAINAGANFSLAPASASSSGPMSVSLEGATFVMQIDGQAVTGVIQKQIVQASNTSKTVKQSGIQRRWAG